MSGQLHLVDAVTVAILPPGAITTDDGVTGCAAAADGTPLALTVVGSQLGQSYVVFTAGATPEQVSLTPPDRAACPSP